MSKSQLEILIRGEGAPLTARPFRAVLVGEHRDSLTKQRTPCASKDADEFAIEQAGREIGTVERCGSRLVARIPGRFGVEVVRSIVDGARFIAANQPPPRPSWMR